MELRQLRTVTHAIVAMCAIFVPSAGQWGHGTPIYPCPDLSAVNWVRHPQSCSKYFICYFGQPISMPDCPNNLVWSNMAKNCVPRSDRWDDCSQPTLPHGPPTRPTHMPVERTWVTHQRRTSKVTIPWTHRTAEIKIVKSTSGSIYTTRPRYTARYTTAMPVSRRTSPPTTTTTRRTTTTSERVTLPKIDYGACSRVTSAILPHPKNCHWYYNCTRDPYLPEWDYFERFTTECRYPQLFDPIKLKCSSFLNVKCGHLYEPKDPCEYREKQCIKQNCVPCNMRYGACRGKANGIYPLESKKWTPMYVTCYLERNIAQDKCEDPTPIFSPDVSDCVSFYDVPKEYNGLRPECSFRKNGFYPDEQGRCGIYFSCKNQVFQGYLECEPGKVFNPATLRCDSADKAPPPCGRGNAPTCKNKRNGYYADSFGRCPYYYECRYGVFLRYHSCDYGSYDPSTKDCVIPPQALPQPCGLRDNPCKNRPSGRYPDLQNRCFGYLECHNGFLIRNETCSPGQVFNEDLGRCGNAAAAPPPCGLAPTCRNRKDGRYAAPLRGCSFFFECQKNRFLGYRRCTYKEGGFFFNRQTGNCDFPQNICPPCGYKWYGCSTRDYH